MRASARTRSSTGQVVSGVPDRCRYRRVVFCLMGEMCCTDAFREYCCALVLVPEPRRNAILMIRTQSSVNGRDRCFADDEIFASKTDDTGKILHAELAASRRWRSLSRRQAGARGSWNCQRHLTTDSPGGTQCRRRCGVRLQGMGGSIGVAAKVQNPAAGAGIATAELTL